VAYGFAAGLLAGVRRLPSRSELDACAPENPVLVGERTGHACSVNSLGVQRIELPPTSEGTDRSLDGEPLGPPPG